MPRPGLPPTPASSAEIRSKDHSEAIEDFALPPAALHSVPPASQSSSQHSRRERESNPDGQASPTGGIKRKRRSMNADMQIAAQTAGAENGIFSLPPPPSRSRKIIQVQPEDASKASAKIAGQAAHSRKRSESGKSHSVGGPTASSNAQAPKSTAASRKTARKTAHSIIERRRRSKMNDEFETLKELVPAARGQNMHKLAILQAGIEYVRYLEDCIHGLRGAQQSSSGPTLTSAPPQMAASSQGTSDVAEHDEDMDEYEQDDSDDNDEEMDDDEENQLIPKEVDPPAGSTPRPPRSGSAHHLSRGSVSDTPSPAIYPVHSQSSMASYALSTGSPSPAILPSYNIAYPATVASSTLPSPALLPNDYKSLSRASALTGSVSPVTGPDADYQALQAHAKRALAYHEKADQEVIATLAMMGTERRRSQEEKDSTDGTRGMSVRDLLST